MPKWLDRRREAKKIQALGPEGSISTLELEALYRAAVSGVDGLRNVYKTYAAQTSAIYRKYNGRDDFGCEQVRMLADTRVAFIGGAGLSVTCNDKKTAAFFDELMRVNKLYGSRFFNLIMGCELKGRMIVVLSVDPGEVPRVSLLSLKTDDLAVLTDPDDVTSVREIMRKDDSGNTISIPVRNGVYIKTGGDDETVNDPTTKLGLCVGSCENYDRALRDMRLLNHVLARITPTFKTPDERSAQETSAKLSQAKWKIGKAYVGTADFDYKTVGSGAHDNLKSEAALCIKTISAIMGLPVHWTGWVDLMSNRSTADSLHQLVDNGTSKERTIIGDAFYDAFVIAQEMYIDNGGTMISSVNTDFDVTIPLIDNENLLERVRALSLAFGDGIISKDTYRDHIPGVDPMRGKELIAEEEEEAQKKAIENAMTFGLPVNTEDDDNGEDENDRSNPGTGAGQPGQTRTATARN